MKKCKKCGVDKSLECFRPYRGRAPGYGRHVCRSCEAVLRKEHYARDPERYAAASRKWCKTHPAHHAATKNKGYHKNSVRINLHNQAKRYGLTGEQLADLKVKQNNRCAICGDLFLITPEVDHCHDTGRVRGLLCGPCNAGLGMFKDSLFRTYEAFRYLRADAALPKPQVVVTSISKP